MERSKTALFKILRRGNQLEQYIPVIQQEQGSEWQVHALQMSFSIILVKMQICLFFYGGFWPLLGTIQHTSSYTTRRFLLYTAQPSRGVVRIERICYGEKGLPWIAWSTTHPDCAWLKQAMCWAYILHKVYFQNSCATAFIWKYWSL